METNFEKPLDAEIAKKQNSTDNNLSTTAKTVVGAINENASAISSNSEAIANLNAKSFDLPENNTNFNNITVAGAYCFSWISNGATYNRPVNQGGLLVVSIGYNAEVKSQQYTDTNGKVHTRGYHDGAWTSWQELAIKSDFTTITEKQILRVSGTSYFTERSGFISRKIGNSIACLGYFNITTQIPEATSFANLQQGTANIFGTVGLVNLDDKKVYVCSVDGGNLQSRVIIPTGYYYVVGTLICLI